MPQLANYAAFDGLHWETGSVRNALDYAGARAPAAAGRLRPEPARHAAH